jgi:hypothetical protein
MSTLSTKGILRYSEQLRSKKKRRRAMKMSNTISEAKVRTGVPGTEGRTKSKKEEILLS